MSQKTKPIEREIVMRDDDFIVSKTDTVGLITYCNPIFAEFSGYSEAELLGQQHNIVRHPDMPRSVFYLLWESIRNGEEFLGYVKNMSRDGSYYWVFATVTPSYKVGSTEIIGYYSVRRKADPAKRKTIEAIYQQMLAAEKSVDRREAITAGTQVLNHIISQSSAESYHEFILTL